MSVICDVCRTPRTRGSHERCAKIRQAAGFAFNADTKLERHPMKNAEGCKPELNNQHALSTTADVTAEHYPTKVLNIQLAKVRSELGRRA